MTNQLTKNEQAMFPKIITERHFKEGSDIRDKWNEKYAFETVINHESEEIAFYEGLNHEALIVIEVKLPNGVIK
jgi:hypothetical protein